MRDWRRLLAWGAASFACVIVLAAIWPRRGSTELERRALADGRIEVVYWDRHSGHEHDSRAALIAEFNNSQNTIYVRAVPIGYNALMEKILTSTAGSAPPDVCSIDGGMLAQLAPQGLFLPLEDFMESLPCLRKEAFLPHIWPMVAFGGHVWGVPTTTDVYCLIWNKAAFRRAGLDPERPPRTITELEDYAARLTIRSDTGAIEQMGFLPWLPWDQSFMWGVLFGGAWYDEVSGRAIAAQNPGVLAAWTWQQSFTLDPEAGGQLAYAMDPKRIAAFSKNIGDYMSANNPFYSGKVAMISEGEWQATFIPKYAPGLEWGVAPLPQPEGVPSITFGPTCIADVIPVTARQADAAKRFLRWFYSPRDDGRPSPASDYNYAIHNIPCRRDEATQERFIGNPKFRVFVEQLLNKPVVAYPVTPVTQFFADQIERFREHVTFRKRSPEEAARELDATVNRELERVRALLARRGA